MMLKVYMPIFLSNRMYSEIHTLTGKLQEYEIKATSDIEDTLLDLIIDIKSMNKEELVYGPQPSHLNQVANYMTIMGAPRGQLLNVLLKNENYPFRAFDVKVIEEWRNNTKRRLILETRDIEDAIELNRPELARHVRFDDRYNWKCEGCSRKLECNEGLMSEINLPKDARRWWDTYQKRS